MCGSTYAGRKGLRNSAHLVFLYASAHTDAGRIVSIVQYARRRDAAAQGELEVLETIAVVLVILWLLGVVTSYTMGGVIHILLVIAIVVILVRVIQGRRI